MTEKQTSRTLQQFVETLEIGEAIGHQNLTLVPLRGEGREQLDYILGAEAIEAGTLTIMEVDESGSVPELLAVNETDQMILLLDGEELVGAKQNRILNTSLLLRPRSKTKIPVSCVEEGRWHDTSAHFCVGHYSPSSLRARKSRDVSQHLREAGEARSDQGAVWDSVKEEVAACGAAPPPTMAMHDVFEQRQESFDAYVDALEYPKGACGVIAAINGRFAATDVFDKAETLQQIWRRLITGYAMDALARKRVDSKADTKSFTAKGAKALLEHMGEIECEPCPSVGVGRDWRFEAEDIVGQSLVAKRVCVHLSVFPNEDDDRVRRSCSPRIMPPSRRGRRSDSSPEDVV